MENKNSSPIFWPRAIILVDMNAFFASIEQLDNPHLRGKPVAVTNGMQGTCIITSSYEARAFGVKTGMRLKEAKQRCPGLIQCPSNPKRYGQVSREIMAAFEQITPDLEIFSVDEAFLDVSRCQNLMGNPVHIAHKVQALVEHTSGLQCSIGVSGDKTTAKFAAKLQKPNGFTVITPWEAKQRLHAVPVTELCGIGPGIGNFLARYGVYTCGDMEKLPISILSQRFGNLGRRLWYMCLGADPEPVQSIVADPKSMGHGKVMPPNTQDPELILLYLLHMAEKLGARLRRHDLLAQRFFIGLRSYALGWLGGKVQTAFPTNDGTVIFELARQVVKNYWHGEGVGQVQITALDPKESYIQYDLFTELDEQRQSVNTVVDEVNQRFGDWCIAPARLLGRSKMPNVIAPAWKPSGPRQTV